MFYVGGQAMSPVINYAVFYVFSVMIKPCYLLLIILFFMFYCNGQAMLTVINYAVFMF